MKPRNHIPPRRCGRPTPCLCWVGAGLRTLGLSGSWRCRQVVRVAMREYVIECGSYCPQVRTLARQPSMRKQRAFCAKKSQENLMGIGDDGETASRSSLWQAIGGIAVRRASMHEKAQQPVTRRSDQPFFPSPAATLASRSRTSCWKSSRVRSESRSASCLTRAMSRKPCAIASRSSRRASAA